MRIYKHVGWLVSTSAYQWKSAYCWLVIKNLLKYIFEIGVNRNFDFRRVWKFCWALSNAISGGNWLLSWDCVFLGGTLYPSVNYGGKGQKMVQNDKTKLSHSVSQELYSYDFGIHVQITTEFILKYFCVMGHNILTKFPLVSFPQKSSFNTIVQFGHNLGQNHRSCPR